MESIVQVADRQYEDFARFVLENGEDKKDRTGVGTRSYFDYTLRYDLSKGLPVITTKKVPFMSVVAELLWFLSGSTNNNDLLALGSTIWNEWAGPDGELGPIYGSQWRSWKGADGQVFDQISMVRHLLLNHPDSRRILVSAWNVAEIDKMALPPCHCLFQFYTSRLSLSQRIKLVVDAGGTFSPHDDPEYAHDCLDAMGVPSRRLSCKLTQRSADIFLGVPFNITSYSLLIHMLAQQVGMVPGEFIWSGGDCHIYSNHFEQVQEMISREAFAFPQLVLNPCDSIFSYEKSDFELVGYRHHAAISAPVAV